MLDEIPLGLLLAALAVLLLISACFSGSETALMSLNRYRLRHREEAQHPGAIRVARLLRRPDRLISLILLGNNFVNILAASIATIIAVRLLGDEGIAVASIVLTIVVLLFAEVTPKTLAALHPERVAFPAAYVLGPLLKLLYPLVWLINVIANALLGLFGVHPHRGTTTTLNQEELRVILSETGLLVPKRHQRMLLSILDLGKMTVNDVIVPRHEIDGIDINSPVETIVNQLTHCAHTRLYVYQDNIDHVVGILHLRKALHLIANNNFNKESLRAIIKEPYFIPEGTSLNLQLLNFQRGKRRTGLVVDEYGDILGLVTLEDILEEIVGKFTVDDIGSEREIHPQPDGSYLIAGSSNIRELNRTMQWDLPTNGPKTLNGLIIEYLETIPNPGISLRLGRYFIDIVQTSGNAVRTARIRPPQDENGKDVESNPPAPPSDSPQA
ncbi:HlyC/CorC family transporter [Nitrosococcus wardiae]|uniref:HlyC/CorC family transporter n=1 Tax=Nitrosococcus wardiae TaxID=1814290 RepID=A0A4P7C5V7_9GAMM|nr:HlyC/CorC family transporter [Nitrosococcus wardiae]QBQ56262.1 HlyC/CorC family transporter [Nitrosococcus wardiae]